MHQFVLDMIDRQSCGLGGACLGLRVLVVVVGAWCRGAAQKDKGKEMWLLRIRKNVLSMGMVGQKGLVWRAAS